MNDERLENLERQLANRRLPGAPVELRSAVLADVRGELLAARRDRWLARAAGVMLLVGIGMNLSTALPSGRSTRTNLAGEPAAESLAQLAATVAEATDAETGGRFARQFAALAGWSLTSKQSAAIDSAVHLRRFDKILSGKEG